MPFIEYLKAHQQGCLVVPTGLPIEWRRQLANRTTDLHVRKKTGLIPLSVSADRIGHAAMRCAALLALLVAEGVKVGHTGRTGRVVEVYPAASLYRWGLAHQGYKRRANVATLNGMVDALLASATWLRLGAFEEICRSNDDAFAAVIAALSARAWARQQTSKPSPRQASLAASEGWIAVPKCGSLDRLVEIK